MTLLKQDPSAQIPWQKTMLGLPLDTRDISSAPTAGRPVVAATATAAPVDKKFERLRLLCVFIVY